jgi:two-component system KDP operon response regulator KdpE
MLDYADSRLKIDFASRAVTLDGEPLALTRKEYDLFAFLARHSGELVPRATLLRSVWGYSDKVRTRTLDAHVARLRSRLGRDSAGCIETVVRVGYRFKPLAEESGPAIAAAAGVPLTV